LLLAAASASESGGLLYLCECLRVCVCVCVCVFVDTMHVAESHKCSRCKYLTNIKYAISLLPRDIILDLMCRGVSNSRCGHMAQGKRQSSIHAT